MPRLPQILTDSPVTQLLKWAGFSAKKEKTMLPPNFLIDPAQNCFMPDGDKVIPRDGSQRVFQGTNPILNVGTIGGYEKFKNFAAIEMDVKAYREETAGEQVYVLFNGVYVPITLATNTEFNGIGKIYFSTYNDTDLDFSKSKGLSRLCWVNGYASEPSSPPTPATSKGRVFSWTGGISVIDTIVTNIVTIPAGKTFRQLGFTKFFDGGSEIDEIHVTINGVDYFSTDITELDGDTLTLNASPTAVAGDIVSSTVESDELVAPMELLRQSKNYMYYGNEMYRQWWMSNQFGRPSVTRITQSNASQDDLIIDPSTNYTGKGRNIYKLIITDIHPAIDIHEQVFITPQGGSNDANWDYSAYSGGTARNVYQISIVTNTVFTRLVGSQTGTFIEGEVIVGATSGALGLLFPGSATPDLSDMVNAYVNCYQGAFQTGEVITGQTSGATMTLFQSLIGNT